MGQYTGGGRFAPNGGRFAPFVKNLWSRFISVISYIFRRKYLYMKNSMCVLVMGQFQRVSSIGY